MKFFTRRRRQPPAIIIVSLIDVLIVLLIFLVTTTTFKQQPAIQLTLPESKQAKKGTAEGNLIVTIGKKEPFYYFGPQPASLDKLRQEFRAAFAKNPEVILSIRADDSAPWGKVVKLQDLAYEEHIKKIFAYTKSDISPR